MVKRIHTIPLGQLLLERREVSEENLQVALNEQKGTGKALGDILIEKHFAPEESVYTALADQIGYKYISSLPVGLIDKKVLDRLDINVLRKKSVVPIRHKGSTCFVISDPSDDLVIKYLAEQGYISYKRLLTTPANIETLYSEIMVSDRKTIGKQIDQMQKGGVDYGEGELVRYVHEVLDTAISNDATDIHFEPEGHTARIRIRIDGILYEEPHLKIEKYDRLVNVLYSMAQVTVSEFRKFQDKQFTTETPMGKKVDVRLSSIPTEHGNRASIVLRLLNRERSLSAISKLGFSKDSYNKIRKVIEFPYGMVIFTGPTGSGKTTTLYSILQELRGPKIKIITIEDPIEIDISMVQQVQINEKAGITFPEASRRFLRHDPDIILIGEIRDKKTAEEAIRAAMTGHKVFTTLHTNSAIDSISRFLDLGVSRWNLASSLLAVVAQRLIRVLCPNCKEKDDISKYKELDIKNSKTIYKASKKGCKKCNNRGYKGRTAVSEVFIIDNKIRSVISNSFNVDELIKAAKEQGYRTLFKDAMSILKKGETSVEEIKRVVGVM